MADAIINCLFAVVSLIAFYVLYIFAIAEFMPRFLLSPSYQKHVPTDKGVGKYKFPEGRGVVCVPDEKYKSYLKEYALFLYKNKKYIKCRLSDETVSIRYEVAVYNYKNRLIRVIDLAENIEVKGESKTVRLPDNTAYVSVILKAVNEQKRFSTLRHTSFAKICTFSVLTVAMTVA